MADREVPPTLHRHVEPTRRHLRWWWALAATGAANAALTLALAGRPAAVALVVIVDAPSTTPAVVPVVVAPAPPASPVAVDGDPRDAPVPAVPPAPVLPFSDLGPCPAPIAAPAGGFTQPTEGLIVGVAPSPTDGRLIAAWTSEEVYVSRDAGRSWARILDGDGEVLDAGFDCHGRAAVVRTSGLGVRDGHRERWHAIDGLALTTTERRPDGSETDAPEDTGYRPRLVSGGRAIAILGRATASDDDARLAVLTYDAGATWQRSELGWYEVDQAHGAWRGDTLRVVVPWTDCRDEGLRVYTIGPSGTREVEAGAYAASVALDGGALLVAAGPYACPEAEGAGLCVWRRGQWTARPAPAWEATEEAPALIGGPVDVMVVGDRVYRVSARGVGAGRPWGPGWRPVATDRRGRLWGIDDAGQLVRS